MFVAAAVLITAAVALSVAFALFMRSWVLREKETETRLHDPRTHTIAYAIPNGVDPVVFAVAVDRAGFTHVTERFGNAECIRVECPEAEREHLRSVLESIPVPQYDGSSVSAAHVVFEDER
ncbi:hypothetical protein [Nocardioides sp.]|uniref:hypothetical protein n=1 Tax=Nocardioides sp. TaxID=35761 RepID=UPI002D7F8E33|nr:hypothetical protein [Nocardioides sp.]HET8960872.1 hypothetical protein [Nocardioides sp.]